MARQGTIRGLDGGRAWALSKDARQGFAVLGRFVLAAAIMRNAQAPAARDELERLARAAVQV